MSLPNELMNLSNAIFHSVDKLTLRLLKKLNLKLTIIILLIKVTLLRITMTY